MTSDSDSACKNPPLGDLQRSGNVKFASLIEISIFKKVFLNPIRGLVFLLHVRLMVSREVDGPKVDGQRVFSMYFLFRFSIDGRS